MFDPRAVLLVAILVAFPRSADGQDLNTLGNQVAWRVSAGVPSGHLKGRVFGSHGQPLHGVMVAVVGADVHAVTDSGGMYSIAPQVPGSVVVRFRHIGFLSVADTIVVPWDHGVFAVTVMAPATMHGLCSEIVTRAGDDPGDLSLTIVDSVSGLPLTGRVEIRLEHASGTIVNEVDLNPRSFGRAQSGIGRSISTRGVHRIRVSVPGYHPWTSGDVMLDLVPGCIPMLLNREHVVRLVPTSGSRS